jgi:hypothetical protein
MLAFRLSTTVAGLAAVLLAMTMATATASAHELKSSGEPSNDDDHSGYFVWNDGHDLHVQMASGDDSTSYRGTLHTDGTFHSLSRDGDNMHASISDDGHTLRFRSDPNDGSDQLKVRVEDNDKVHLDLKRDGDSAPTDRIWVGGDDEHPSDNSFTLRI